MSVELYLAFCAAFLLLLVIPGQLSWYFWLHRNDLLAMSVSVFWSRPDGLKTAGGAAWAPQATASVRLAAMDRDRLMAQLRRWAWKPPGQRP